MSKEDSEKARFADFLGDYVCHALQRGEPLNGDTVLEGIEAYEQGYSADALRYHVTVILDPRDEAGGQDMEQIDDPQLPEKPCLDGSIAL